MKISIITAVYNSFNFIDNCLQSIVKQTYNDIEHIVIDGGSTDGTLDVINKYRDNIATLISEPDNGIYDAMNKGIKLARGEIIGILNSDDFYVNDTIIEKVVDTFKKYNVDSCYGDLIYVDKNDTNKVIRYWKSSQYKYGSFKYGWHPPHPTFFVKKEVYDKYGAFDTNFEISADFELMLRFLEKYRITTIYLPEPIIKMRFGGVSNKNLKNIIIGNINCYRAFKKNSLTVPLFYFFYRLFPKAKQFFAKNQ
jgi:glycosyltransferase